ncbi:MAG: ATPase [Clostridia bacterium]|nr:ATPase [Clostridia bacterium]
MEILDLLNELEEEIENAFTIPFTSNGLIDKEKIFGLIKDIRINFPDQLKEAQFIKTERQKILIDAQKQSEIILSEAEEHIKSMVNQSEIIKKAEIQAQKIISNANKSAREIRVGSREYADQILDKLERNLNNLLSEIKNNREELRR